MLNKLRRANNERQQLWPGNTKCDLEFRTIEFNGEAGELSNKVKKYLRRERGIAGSHSNRDEIAEEMADVIITLDLMASKLSIDLSLAVIEKFNKDSEKMGFDVLL